MKHLKKIVTISERAFLIDLYSHLKSISNDFIMKLASGNAKVSNTSEQNFKLFKELSKEDEPLFRFWILSYFNKHKCKPIIKDVSYNKFSFVQIEY